MCHIDCSLFFELLVFSMPVEVVVPEISIIIPVYNTGPFLRKCLDSVLAQTFEDMEIICVNDGSTDDSLSILREYTAKDKRLVIIDKSNGGVASARNTGIRAAAGAYIGFVDSDDWIEPETYATAIKYMTNDVDLVCWSMHFLGNIEQEKKISKIFADNLSGKFAADPKKKFALSTTICDKLFKKSIIEDNDIYIKENIRYEDTWFLWKYMLHVRTFFCLEQKFYHYLLHQESFMASRYDEKNSEHLTDHLYGLYEVYLHYDKYGAASEYREFFARRFYRYFRKIYRYMPNETKNDLLACAAELALKMDLKGGEYGRQLSFLRLGEYKKLKVVIDDQPSFIKRLCLNVKSWI